MMMMKTFPMSFKLRIKTIFLMGQQNLAFRGRCDDGRIVEDEENPLQNEENFRQLLRFSLEVGDTVLGEHLQNLGSNAVQCNTSVRPRRTN
jgi:hypothetical protein